LIFVVLVGRVSGQSQKRRCRGRVFCRSSELLHDLARDPSLQFEILYKLARRSRITKLIMSYYFCIVNTNDKPLFELEFGTSKQGGDGIARFTAEARQMNPFIVHSSLDIVDEMQWLQNQMFVSPKRLLNISCPRALSLKMK